MYIMKKLKTKNNEDYKNRRIYIIVFAVILPIVAGVAAILTIINGVNNMILSNSDLKVDLVESKYYGALSGEQEIRYGINNQSNDAKPITKAVLKVTNIEIDSTINMNIVRISDGENVLLKVYNSGWNKRDDVSFKVIQNSDFYCNLKEPNKNSINYESMNPGQLYDLFTISKLDLSDSSILSDPLYSYPIEYTTNNNLSPVACSGTTYAYNEAFDTIIIPGKGGSTDTYPLSCCIETEKGNYDYELPIAYTCNAHDYEEIKLILTSDKTCSLSYIIEFYSNEKCLYKSESECIEITIDSHNGPPDLSENQ